MKLVPSDQVHRHLERTLDVGFVRDLVRDAYVEAGRPSTDPVVFFKLQLIVFHQGPADQRSLRWYLGYDLTEPLPDHSSLSRIRERYGLENFRRRFLSHCQRTQRGIYGAPTAACALRSKCTTSSQGRRMGRHLAEAYVDRVCGYHATAPCAKSMCKLQIWVEPHFAEATAWHRPRRSLLRALEKVSSEALLIAAGQNLKRLLIWRGWGRRPFPSGAAGDRPAGPPILSRSGAVTAPSLPNPPELRHGTVPPLFHHAGALSEPIS